MMNDVSATVRPATEAPVLVRRDTFSKLVSTAQGLAQGAATADDLVALVLALEAERHAVEWEAEDATVAPDNYVGDERGYFRWWNLEPEFRDRPGQPAWVQLWQDGDQDIAVFDEPPVPADRIARLESLGTAKRQPTYPPQAPFRFVLVRDPTMVSHAHGPTLSVDNASGPPGGAWIVSDPERNRVAWAKSRYDASFMTSLVNAATRLNKEVSRYGGGTTDFVAQVEKSGLRGLVRMLRRSIEPEERWESEPPEALRTAGAELERVLVEFLDARQMHRCGQPRGDTDRGG